MYETTPYYPTDPSTSGEVCLGLNPHAGSYYLSAMTSQGLPIRKTIFQSSARTSSSSSSGVTPYRDSIEHYPGIEGSDYRNLAIEAHCISMVGSARADSRNSSSKYPTIRGYEVFDAQTPSNKVVWNLNPDFNIVRIRTIMESIQWMVLQDSPLVALAQQGAKVAGHIIAAKRLVANHRGEPSVGDRSVDRAKCTRSKATSSALASGNRRLPDNDARR
jgi:hypothetical protein